MKIVTVSDLIKILDTKENRYGATGKPRILNLSLNGNFAGSIKSVKLDGYGDGLITDVTMEITSSKFTTTNADRIRNMSDYDLGDLLQSVCSGAGNGNPFISLCVDDNEITMNFSDIYEWLQSEAEQREKNE